ncbi:MAG: GNAT family N-acetyltransferase [Candidatus Hydrogenedentes bacterium]|nr:GNAT family N-acetyltransferase [Candidatus Hydrogenedentota bacterium]
MTNDNTEISDAILVNLRKIVRAMDLQSRQLQRNCALTSPQLVLLREIVRHNEISIGALATQASLSNATVTGIVDRLEQRGLVVRNRNGKDRRQVLLSSTEEGRTLCGSAPPLMQKQFLDSMAGLQQWEQAQMLAALSRLSGMMTGTPQIKEEFGECTPPNDGFLTSCQMLLDNETATIQNADKKKATPEILVVRSDTDFPETGDRMFLANFLHEHLKPYEDNVEEILQGLEYALSGEQHKGGFILLARIEGRLTGALVILNTGMTGYVPEHLLLFIAVNATMRGCGIGSHLIRRAQELCTGDMKLHVEYDNPARRLYEQMNFTSKYADMRWKNELSNHKS